MKNNLYTQKSKCLIIQCEFSSLSFWNYTEVCKIAGAKYPAAPLGLLTVAALLPQYWEFKLVDQNCETLRDEHFEWADIICTGGMLPQQKGIREIITRAHKSGIPVVVGGPDPTAQPELYKDADYLVRNEGELTIPMFLKDLEKGALKGEYSSDEMADMSKSPIPRFDLIDFKNYLHVGIQYSRGCPFTCEFCDIIELFGRKPRIKTNKQVLAELDTLHQLNYRGHVDFVDDNFIGNKNNVKKILPEIIQWSKERKFPFYFTTEASINLADDDQLLNLMRQCDFRFVFIGIETPDNTLLQEMGKRQNINKSIKESILKIYRHGMVVNGGFILGFDNEPETIAKSMMQFIQDTGVSVPLVGTLYALPRTRLTRRLQSEGRLLEAGSNIRSDYDIDQLTNGLNFITKRPRMEILRDYAAVISSIYNPKNYFARLTYTALNLKPANKFTPNPGEIFKYGKAAIRVIVNLGFQKSTAYHFWKMFFAVLVKNFKGIEAAVNLAALFIHFQKQSKFVIELTGKKINTIESIGEEKFNKMLRGDKSLSLFQKAAG